jgi:hypothetical protein
LVFLAPSQGKAGLAIKFYCAGLFEFLLFLGIAAGLIALHSRRLDNGLAIVWLLILIGGSARMLYKSWAARSDPVASRRIMTGRWAAVLPPKVVRWMYGESDRPEPK